MANLLQRLRKRFTRGGEPLPQPAVFPFFAKSPPEAAEQEWQRRIRVMNERIDARRRELKISGGGRTETNL